MPTIGIGKMFFRIRRSSSFRKNGERGAVMAEYAIGLSLSALLFAGIFDIGLLLYRWGIITYSTADLAPIIAAQVATRTEGYSQLITDYWERIASTSPFFQRWLDRRTTCEGIANSETWRAGVQNPQAYMKDRFGCATRRNSLNYPNNRSALASSGDGPALNR